MGENEGYNVDIISYPATGLHGSKPPDDIIQRVMKSNIVIALTEY
jgi:hypothetical protein